MMLFFCCEIKMHKNLSEIEMGEFRTEAQSTSETYITTIRLI